MQELVEYIIKSLVTNPDDVVVEENREGDTVTLSLKVNPADMGLVIGKQGSMIKAVRKLLTVRAMAENVRIFLQLVDVPQAPAQE